SVWSTAVAVPPWPSHCTCLQSPGVCVVSGVPCVVLATPQTPFVQVRWWHSVSVPGQPEAVRQLTQAPWPSQIVLVPQLVPAETLGLLGVPAVQTSLVHGLPSTGRSVSSLTVTIAPPLQTFFLQSR